ncbi:hypothetical protein ACMDCR_24475 [Labrys okinawensis]|uniref:hypothetical protein n=1 Tax=Labrys okinawensis TaxID=346911 RepID=UPI0039BC7B97
MRTIASVAAKKRCSACNIKQSHAFVPATKEVAERRVTGQITEVPGLEDLGYAFAFRSAGLERSYSVLENLYHASRFGPLQALTAASPRGPE